MPPEVRRPGVVTGVTHAADALLFHDRALSRKSASLMVQEASQANAGAIVRHLKLAGIDLVSTLPDLWLAPVIQAIDADPAMTLIRLTREDEGLGICAGAYLGGRRAALLAQNAGLLLSINVLAGLAFHHQIPTLLLIAQRGEPGDNQFYHAYKGRVTEPVLRGLGIPYHRINRTDDLHLIEDGYEQAIMLRMPVALLLSRRLLTGLED